MSLRLVSSLTLATTLGLAACAQPPFNHASHHPVAAPGNAEGPAAAGPMARMDQHIVAMRGMHGRMMQAKTPEERSALMPEHTRLMQEGMAMMNGMAPGGDMRSMMGNTQSPGPMTGDRAAQQPMLEKRMEMMQGMMQMMMDRMPAAPGRP